MHRVFAGIDGLVDASGISTEVLDPLERPASILVEPLQTMFDLVVSIFPRYETLKEEENRKLWDPIVSHGVKCLYKYDIDGRTTKHSSAEDLMLVCMEGDGGRCRVHK